MRKRTREALGAFHVVEGDCDAGDSATRAAQKIREAFASARRDGGVGRRRGGGGEGLTQWRIMIWELARELDCLVSNLNSFSNSVDSVV